MREDRRHKRRWLRKRTAIEIAARTSATPGEAHASGASDHSDHLHGGDRSLPFELTDFQIPAPDTPDEGGSAMALVEPSAPPSTSVAALEPVQAAVSEPVSPEQLDSAARDAVEQGELKQAMRLYRTLLEMNDDDLDVKCDLALLMNSAGEHEEALQMLDECVSSAPTAVKAWVTRGTVLGAAARYNEAESDLREALELDPSNADGHFNLGLVAIKRGRWIDAIPHLRRALELDSSNAAAHFYSGEALNHVDDISGALQAYQKATELQPTNPAAFYGLGIVLDRLGRPEEATQMYRRSREIAVR